MLNRTRLGTGQGSEQDKVRHGTRLGTGQGSEPEKVLNRARLGTGKVAEHDKVQAQGKVRPGETTSGCWGPVADTVTDTVTVRVKMPVS